MTLIRSISAIVLVGALSATASAKSHQPTLRDKEQAACAHDATTLCKDAIPDEDKIEACMRAKFSQVSPGCKKYFK